MAGSGRGRDENTRALRIETWRRDFMAFHEISSPGGPMERTREPRKDEIDARARGPSGSPFCPQPGRQRRRLYL